jgi:hypothetical protein
MPTTENRNTETSRDLLLESLCQLDQEDEDGNGFARALQVSSGLLASSELLPMNANSEHYNEAIKQVMSANDRHRVEGAAETFETIASNPVVRDVIDTLHLDNAVTSNTWDLGALATEHAYPQVDAAYRLGVAMGIVFSRTVDGAR